MTRIGDAIDVCSCACDRVAVVCAGESIVGVIDAVTKALATVPPMVFVTVPGVKMRNPVGVDNGALTRTKLLAPEREMMFI